MSDFKVLLEDTITDELIQVVLSNSQNKEYASKVKMTGKNKLENKKYYNVSQYLGGLRTRSAKTMLNDYPEELIERVVWGMIPKGPLGRKQIKHLFVYAGSEHPHAAQNPEVLEVK